jgi:diguanylate cyclase (GGDEF)-like protein
MFRLDRLRAQVPTLYVTTMLVVMTSMSAADARAPGYIKYGLPMAIIVACAVRLIWWVRTRRAIIDPSEAQRIINRAAVIAALICATAAGWTVASWLESVPGQRTYYPLFMVTGALAAAFCLSSARVATVLVLATGVGPVLAAQVLAGNEMDRLAAGVILLATLFLLRMNQQQHDQQIDLLRLQRSMREQAATDALTGIGNRRALYERLQGELAQGRSVGLVLLDLDGFKPVNDAHGHAAGDRLLIAVAERLRAIAPDIATAYRLGGDEFAVVANRSGDYETQLLATSILGGIATPFDIDGLHLAIGACTGAANSRAEDSIDSLLARADERLYVAKALRYAGGFDRRALRQPKNRRQA